VDASTLPEKAFDIVCLFDAFHHMTDPGAVLDGIRASLRPGGWVLLAEAALSGDAAADAADPTAVIVYGSDLIYCFQESKLAGQPGLGATWPGRGLSEILARHGFAEIGQVESQAGYVVVRAVAG
jgi:SAM-dependent methyltransferase